ncbi:MAG: polymerase sigma-70 factor [Myxococcaceae bacterium]|nr:polymerase sigma-70 factor [Myxococcaceae bacterium]
MTEPSRASSNELVEHYFRHEYARLVATLARVFGMSRIELVEDAVQSSLMLALTSWGLKGAPDDPGAWLYRAAHNRILDSLRSQKTHWLAQQRGDSAQLLPERAQEPPPRFSRELEDDQLRMLFVCCDSSIPVESQLVLALKILCGFSAGEIARALFISEANVRKRLERARERLRELAPTLETPDDASLRDRLGRVHTVIYLLFNEGYHSSQADRVIRRELCEEAIRLCTLLGAHPMGAVPETSALLALMCFHAARFAARVDGEGGLLLLEEQDRALWDQALVQQGCVWLARSASGEHFTRYHAEAGIAAEHCLAASFAETRWHEIAELYELLERVAPSPLHVLNRAVAIAQFRGPEAALRLLEQTETPAWLLSYYLRDAVLGELHRQAGDYPRAREHLERALRSASTEAERGLLRKRLVQCGH